ncbi:hypothetical protein L1987_86109 [Smallanthus sonchifolius]|uniref:Uncharacterized protein n=1 Tax=Smallanthus sonchifolius TaxID=185202 RepID=A0ACB8XYU7_9ASTR|nr:hypothetical protein L1987_86109 [Smallanthus sonchifolius]
MLCYSPNYPIKHEQNLTDLHLEHAKKPKYSIDDSKLSAVISPEQELPAPGSVRAMVLAGFVKSAGAIAVVWPPLDTDVVAGNGSAEYVSEYSR